MAYQLTLGDLQQYRNYPKTADGLWSMHISYQDEVSIAKTLLSSNNPAASSWYASMDISNIKFGSIYEAKQCLETLYGYQPSVVSGNVTWVDERRVMSLSKNRVRKWSCSIAASRLPNYRLGLDGAQVFKPMQGAQYSTRQDALDAFNVLSEDLDVLDEQRREERYSMFL